MIFGGFGPIILGIVYMIISATTDGFTLHGWEVLLGIVSTYAVAFVQAGASVFNQIEHWPVAKSLLCHLGSIYAVYALAYVVNSWIPFDIAVLGLFTLIFLAAYFAIWLIVAISVKIASKKMNARLKD